MEIEVSTQCVAKKKKKKLYIYIYHNFLRGHMAARYTADQHNLENVTIYQKLKKKLIHNLLVKLRN